MDDVQAVLPDWAVFTANLDYPIRRSCSGDASVDISTDVSPDISCALTLAVR